MGCALVLLPLSMVIAPSLVFPSNMTMMMISMMGSFWSPLMFYIGHIGAGGVVYESNGGGGSHSGPP